MLWKTTCGTCGSKPDKLLICSRCHCVYYCNRSCQKLSWKQHKKVCFQACKSAYPPRNNMNYMFELLPLDIIKVLYEYLDVKSIVLYSTTHSYLYDIMHNSNNTWKYILKTRFPIFYDHIVSANNRTYPPVCIRSKKVSIPPPLASRCYFSLIKDVVRGTYICNVQVYDREKNTHLRHEYVMSCYNALCIYYNKSSYRVSYEEDGRGIINEIVPLSRLRTVPITDACLYDVYFDKRLQWCELHADLFVEIQWKLHKSHPFGWWGGRIDRIINETHEVIIIFAQYPESSSFHSITFRFQQIHEETYEPNSNGWIGGLRVCTPQERQQYLSLGHLKIK